MNNSYRSHRRPVRRRLVEVSRRKMHTVRTRSVFVLPNMFTAASLFCAFLSIIEAIDAKFALAAVLIILSMIFDGMDGRVARATHTQSNFGEQFDSIADMSAFGVAPGILVYKYCLFDLGSVGMLAAFVYCLCAGVRLARFNCNIGVVDKRFFQGLPSPAAAALVAGFVWLCVENRMPAFVMSHLSWIAWIVTLYAGLTMVCNAPFFSGKSAAAFKTMPFWLILVTSVLFVTISSNPPLSIFVLFCLYALSGYLYQGWLFFFDRPNPVIPQKASEEKEQ